MSRITVAVLATLLLADPLQAVDYVQGIDVSHWQGNINWTSVKNAGIKFAFAKATEGVDFVDVKFHQNMAGAKAAGVLIGPYHFGRPDSFVNDPLDAVKEADDFVNAIQPYYQTPGLVLRPVLDLEQLPSNPPGTMKVFLSKWVRDFNGRVESRLGFPPIIYTSRFIAQNYLESDIAHYDLWIAKPTNTNVFEQAVLPTTGELGIWDDWTFWQWSWVGNVGGINPVDRNAFQGTMEQLGQFAPNFHAGDYNGDGIVNAADYVLWRKAVGQTVNPGMGSDGNLSGVVDQSDLQVWRANFGNSYAGGAGASAGTPRGSSTAVPEPASLLLLLLGMTSVFTGHISRRLPRSTR